MQVVGLVRAKSNSIMWKLCVAVTFMVRTARLKCITSQACIGRELTRLQNVAGGGGGGGGGGI